MRERQNPLTAGELGAAPAPRRLARLRVLGLLTALGGLAAALLAVPPAGGAAAAPTPIYLNRSYSFAERAADLVSRMTLAQKASEMNSSMAAAIPGLGVQPYSWWNEAAHGVAAEGMSNNTNAALLWNTTSYPTSLALGSSWDPALMHQEAGVIAAEAREVEADNTLNMDFYAPVVNLMRDPRWGRSDEAYSEDPFLTAQLASQFVNGMQGQDMAGHLLPQGHGYYKTLTTLKHYTANNSEADRLTGSADMDQRTLEEYYTEQFRKVIQQAHPGSIMSSYNEVNGTPSPVSVNLTDTLARETFGFGGYFTSDCDAIYMAQHGHQWVPPGQATPVDEVTRHAYALSAGEDLDCNMGYNDGHSYANELPAAVAAHVGTLTGTLTENNLDVSLERLFTARMELGEFDAAAGAVPWVNQARASVPPGSWQNSNANQAVTETPARLQLARRAGDATIVLLKNAAATGKGGTGAALLPLRVPRSGPYKVAVMGYFANPARMYLGDYSSIQGSYGAANEVNPYQGIRAAIQAINPQASVDYLQGVYGGNQASQLTSVSQADVAAAAKYDAVVVVAGTDRSTGTEAQDRATTALPGAQGSLIQQVAAQNPNTVAYLETDGMVDVRPFAKDVPALLWSAFNGMRAGQSLADVLLGRYNPSGRLPFTWYQGDENLPPITDYTIRPDGTSPGRTYMYYRGPLSYPFGYGLSYSAFRFSRLRIDNTRPDANATIHVTADVTNTGPAAGNEVAELYVNTPHAPAALQRPAKRLEGFQKVFLWPGQTRAVGFTLKVADLAFFNQAGNRWQVDDGQYGIQLSTSTADADIQQQGFINVSGALRPALSVVTAKPTMPSDAGQDIHGRLIFPAGTAVLPNLTVSMSDDTLYGYITKGASRPLPAGLRISYRSDHPDVVAVSPDGQAIRTTAKQGAATVTAVASYHGVTRTCQFVIYNTGTQSAGY